MCHFANYAHHKAHTTVHSNYNYTFFCIIIRQPYLPCLPCSVAIQLQPPTGQLTLYACQHNYALHTQHHPPHSLLYIPPLHTTSTRSSWQNDVMMERKYCGVILILFGLFWGFHLYMPFFVHETLVTFLVFNLGDTVQKSLHKRLGIYNTLP